MEKRKIKAEIVCGSLNEHGQKITTWVLTYPRIIHAEMMTHRVFSRNAASSRAIPALKMIADIEADPFIPVAFQKDHKGMQGTEYFTEDDDKIEYVDGGHYNRLVELRGDWLNARDSAVRVAKKLSKQGLTKQLVNRLLEPFQWYTAIFTSTEISNFMELRCPSYEINKMNFKSRKEATVYLESKGVDTSKMTLVDWLKINKGQGEIHISLLAEAMWDSINEYDYRQLKAGEWHIPFGDRFDVVRLQESITPPNVVNINQSEIDRYQRSLNEAKIKIATARCARVSYNNFEGKDDYEADVKLYDILKSSGHFSPFEHCARAMALHEYHTHYRTTLETEEPEYGWSGNFRGFVQLRQEL